MSLLTIILFFLYLYGLGYSLTRFVKRNNVETLVMRLGVGLGALPVLGLLLNELGILLDWKIFFLLSLILPLYDCICYWKNQKRITVFTLKAFRQAPDFNMVCLGIIFVVSLVVLCAGPFAYPYLEDGDSWNHAAGAKYIAVEKNINVPPETFRYINPYPPSYDLIFGILHQTSISLSWTIKFFNGLIIALGFLFFYFFVQEISGDSKRALLATFCLACLPCYLSHFIWAHALVITLFFPAFYLALKSVREKRFIFPASIVTSTIFLTQPTQAIKFVVLFVILFLALFNERGRGKFRVALIMILSSIISLVLWWGPLLISSQNDISPAQPTVSANSTSEEKENSIVRRGVHWRSLEDVAYDLPTIFHPLQGSATRKYTLEDYLQIPYPNAINCPTGLGLIFSLLSLSGFVGMVLLFGKKRGKKRVFYGTIVGWAVFIFFGA